MQSRTKMNRIEMVGCEFNLARYLQRMNPEPFRRKPIRLDPATWTIFLVFLMAILGYFYFG